jgi:hypothetical protein
MTERSFNVLGVDISPLAVRGPFRFVFDCGCFHVFDRPDERQRFAAGVSAMLAPGGLGLSLIGSTEGLAHEFGPPRRSAVEVVLAIEL